MKILYYEDHENWIHGMPRALRAMGHSVYVPKPREKYAELQASLTGYGPDCIITMGWTARHRPEYLGAIRDYCSRTKSLHVFWSAEDPIHTDTYTLDFLEKAEPDAVATISPKTVPFFQELGYPSLELPFACDPFLHHPGVSDRRFACDIALVGNLSFATAGCFRRQSLELLLKPLLRSRLRIGIWGEHWRSGALQQLGCPIPAHWLRGRAAYTDVPAIYRSARIVLGPQNDTEQLTRRTFEAMACGAAVISPRTPGIKRFFCEGRHVLCTGSAAETLTLVQKCLAGSTFCRRIGGEAAAEVHSRHTYAHRAAVLMEAAGEWLKEKRRHGFLQTGTGRRRQILVFQSGLTGSRGNPSPRNHGLTCNFLLPAPRPGCRLISATLECFAEQIAHAGDAAVLCSAGAQPDRMQSIRLRARPCFELVYPFKEGWVRWDVTSGVAGSLGGGWVVRLYHEHGLQAVWAQPGWHPADRMMRVHHRRFWPKLVLVWKEDSWYVPRYISRFAP